MRKIMVLCLALVMVCCLMAGCGPAPSTSGSNSAAATGESFAVIKDDMGRTVTLKKKPERIVVTSASFLEPLHEVGGSVVGRPDSRTKMPDYAKDAASIGAVYQIDVERLLACTPDLVIINKGMNEKLVDILKSNNINCIVLDMKSYDSVKNEVKVFSQITGEKEKGDKLIADMEARIAAVQQRIPKDGKRAAILHSTAQGLTVQLDGSIAGSVAKMLGFVNVASKMTPLEKNPDAAPYSIETLVEQNPEILFITSMGKIEAIKKNMQATIDSNPAWQSLPPVKTGQLYYLPQDLFLLSPGIHYPEAVELMAKLVYPEVFK